MHCGGPCAGPSWSPPPLVPLSIPLHSCPRASTPAARLPTGCGPLSSVAAERLSEAQAQPEFRSLRFLDLTGLLAGGWLPTQKNVRAEPGFSLEPKEGISDLWFSCWKGVEHIFY